MRRFWYTLFFLLLTGFGVLCGIRWEAWFDNPQENSWKKDTIDYHFNGFGDEQVKGFVCRNQVWEDVHCPDTLRIILFGDIHNNVDSAQWRNIIARHPNTDCYAQLGDFMERCYFYYYQKLVHELYGSGFDTLPILTTPGNHEYLKKGLVRELPSLWTGWFSNPQNGPERFRGRTYYVDFRGLRLIAIDTNGLQKLSDFTVTLTWLNQVIADAGDRFVVVMMHHPVYSGSVGRQNVAIWTTFQHTLKRADLVFSGHDHQYNRRLPFVGTNSAKKFYLSKVNEKDTRICVGRQLYEVLTLASDTLTMETFLMDSGEKYDEIKVFRTQDGAHEYLDNGVNQEEIIDLPEKYLHKNSRKVNRFWDKRKVRLHHGEGNISL